MYVSTFVILYMQLLSDNKMFCIVSEFELKQCVDNRNATAFYKPWISSDSDQE